MTLHDLLLVLLARWRIVMMSALLSLVVVTGINLAMPKQYRASATVVVDIKGPDPVAGSAVQPQVTPGYLATQVGIVSSDRVVQRVIQSLHLDTDERLRARWQDEANGLGLFALSGLVGRAIDLIGSLVSNVVSDPAEKGDAEEIDTFEYWLTARLAKSLDVRPAHEGSLINITVTWSDAVRAAQIANAFSKAYIDTSLELKVDPAKQYVKWFEDRNVALRKEVERAQERLSKYQRANGVVASTDARLDVESTRLSELSSQLTALQGVHAVIVNTDCVVQTRPESMVEVLQNPVVVSLKGDLAKLESRRADIAMRYGPNYPDTQRLDDQIAVVRGRLNREIGRISSSLKASNQINRQREAEIRREMAKQRQHVLQLSRQRDEIAILQNDVSNAQRAYDTVTQRLAQTSLESQNQITNVMVITPAVRPLGPYGPRIKVNALLALVFGSLFGVALALFIERIDQRLYGADHLRNVLGAPVFGVLGRQGMALPAPRQKRLAVKW